MGEPNIPGGCILLSRKIIESAIWRKPPLYIKVWVYLLSIAQHSDYKNLKRGQCRTSIPEIIEGCYWYVGYRKESPTKDQVFQIIEWLRKPCDTSPESNAKATMITTTKATQGMLVNIENYDYYQTMKNYESNDEPDDENDAKAPREQRQPDNINKNGNNGNNDNMDIVVEIIEEENEPPKEKGNKRASKKDCIDSNSTEEVQTIYNHWIKVASHIHNAQLTDALKKEIISTVKKYKTVDTIIQAIDNYVEVFDSDYYYSHAFTISKFLKQSNCIPRFIEGVDEEYNGDIYKDYSLKYAKSPNKKKWGEIDS